MQFSGYERYPSKDLKFQQLSFAEESGWLWAVDKNQNVYFYHADQYWMKVDGQMQSVSAGLNGVWAVNLDGRLQFRTGINSSNPVGSTWSAVDPSSYGMLSTVICIITCTPVSIMTIHVKLTSPEKI